MSPGQCPFCGPAPATIALGPVRPDGASGVAFTVRACRRCGTRFLDPALDAADESAYYPAAYGPFTDAPAQPGSVEGFRALALAARGRVGAANPLRRAYGALYRFLWGDYDLPVPRPWGTRRALELGCGAGDYLAKLRAAGWDAVGVDPSPHAAQAAERRHGLRIHLGSIETLPAGGPPFQFAAAWEVVEHLKDPVRDLTLMRRRLARDGMFFFSTPDPGSLECRLLGARWAGYDVPRHLALFGRGQARELLRRAGFRAARVDVLRQADNWMLALGAWAREAAGLPAGLRGRLERLAQPHRMDVKTLFLPAAFFFAAFRAGGRMRVIARCL